MKAKLTVKKTFLLFVCLPYQMVLSQTYANVPESSSLKEYSYRQMSDTSKKAVSPTGTQPAQNKSFIVTAELRPRAEFRYGYRQLRADSSEPAYFVNQRTRFNITYKTDKLILHTSIQDIRLYGQTGQFSVNGTIGMFEAYAEPVLAKNLSLRIGRQRLAIDNDRLFSAANWAQASRAHEGIQFIYANTKLTTDLVGAFSQEKENIFGTDFSPTANNNYKILGVHNLKYKFSDAFALTTITATDAFENKTNKKVLYLRATSGGRVEFTKKALYVTVAGYYQYGTSPDGKEIAAYYIQPELQIKINKLTTRLGAEYMTGDDATQASNIYKSFIPLYGVAWKFMGNMDYFTAFPSNTKNGGLNNPYLFLIYDVNNRLSLRADGHLFLTQNKVLNKNKEVIDPYLGFENDLSFRIKFNEYTTWDFGFSYMIATKSMETIKGGNTAHTPIWSYTMITFNPVLFNSSNKNK
ncbi:MAG: hypothetical protein HND27_10060 [Bacteroidetes bacterium]|nr:hypothetical protein [Flavobacteriales bacterium]MCL4817435.1 hypothetical protein [Flavobacteriales bacterium]NOG96105.1 hypothetical protein [Bacteroidota bacterium]WKZ75210.1 MAG: alginate export family protein [Vicingaceae bacterium]CAG0987994.1 hypothetical protein FLAV_02144 [Flavobacteriales bacterium]